MNWHPSISLPVKGKVAEKMVLCEICGRIISTSICRRCGRKICTRCRFHHGLCKMCARNLSKI